MSCQQDHEEISSALDRDDHSYVEGIRAGMVLRPEPFFNRKTRLVIDTHYNPEHNILRNGMEETEFQGINLISLDKLFDNKNEIFLGFGIPNVYLTIPNENKTQYIKFAAFMMWRQVSAIVDTKGRVQSGFLIRFRNLPSDALKSLRESMILHSNQRFLSCAYGNACVLDSAGFTSNSSRLNNHFGARALFKQIFENGLEYKEQPIALDFIRTTRLTLEEHFGQVRKKEWTSLPRTVKKVVNECLSPNDHMRAPVLVPNDISVKPTVIGDRISLTRLEISHPDFLGATIRRFIGSHTLFKITPHGDEVNVSDYLPNTLTAFSMKNPTLLTKLKKTILFSRPVVSTLRRHLASCWDDHGHFRPDSLASMMSIHTKKEPHPYNIVITGDYVIGMHNSPGLKFFDWILSKHVLISGYDDDVRFAGEAWMEHQDNGLLLHLTNNSGTYQPTNEQLEASGKLVTAALPGLRVELHRNSLPSPLNSQPSKDNKNILNIKTLLILLLICMIGMYYFIY